MRTLERQVIRGWTFTRALMASQHQSMAPVPYRGQEDKAQGQTPAWSDSTCCLRAGGKDSLASH